MENTAMSNDTNDKPCSKWVKVRGEGRLLSGLPMIRECSGKPIVTLRDKPYCARHAAYVREYLAAHGDPTLVVWLNKQ